MSVGALLVAAAIAAIAAAPAAPVGPHAWSVEMLDGSPAATSTLFADAVLAPGDTVRSGYLIPHSADIVGPLEVSAEPLTAPNALEGVLSVTFGVDGAAGATVPLTALLRDGALVRATDALPPGTPRLDIAVTMRAASNGAMAELVRFRLLLTVSDQTIVVPVAPTGAPAASPAVLAATGVDPPPLLLVLAVVAGGLIAVVAGRLRRSASQRTPLGPARPRPIRLSPTRPCRGSAATARGSATRAR